MSKFEKIPEGKLRITCLDGISHTAEIKTSNGDLIYASKVIIDLTPGKPCTAIITVSDVQVDVCSEFSRDVSKEKEIVDALSGIVNAFIRAVGSKAIDCLMYPEYEKALLILSEKKHDSNRKNI